MTTTSATETFADLQRGATTEAAMAFFDSLPAVTIEELIGSWAGGEIDTGHPMNGLLAPLGWHGKRFVSADEVYPLVMDRRGGGTFNLNPAPLPVALMMRYRSLLNSERVLRAARAVSPAMGTRGPSARLRMLEYRGVVTATMVYDRQPIHDVFRKIDENTVLGAMDLRGIAEPGVFYLRREA